MSDRLVPVPVPVTVIGGYLGAGKTTLVNHVLRNTDRPVAVLVNDFGDLDVDASLLESSDGEILSFANGCVCCDLSDGLVGALDRLRSVSPAPERILIESSGVGELATIANYAALPGLRLDATVCVVDAESVRERSTDRWVGDLVVGQLCAADFIVCNKVDLVDEAMLSDAHGCIAELASGAVVVDAVRGAVALDVLFEHEHQRSHAPTSATATATETFTSWVCEFDSPVSIDELRDSLAQLPESIVRAKGVVAVETDGRKQRCEVQVVGRRWELVPVGESQTTDTDTQRATEQTSAAEMNAISFIALSEQLDGASLPELFRAGSSHSGLVIAPRSAPDTSRAYFPKTPEG